jgi:hypothetical protein
MDKIFVSIASYRDQELLDTVFSLFKQAEFPNNIFLSIFSQDEFHPDLENIFKLFNIDDYSYQRVHYSDARGVGYARYKTQEPLNTSYKYYLQVDSHTQFISKWDSLLVSDYESAQKYWGDVILTAYPGTYEYNQTGNIKVATDFTPTCVRVQEAEYGSANRYEAKYKTYLGADIGEFHGFFCAGMAFGYSKYFLDVPYDPEIYFNGEEQTMSIRFYCKNIKLVAPPRNYCFHHYTGEKRIRHWENNETWKTYDAIGIQRLNDFYENKLNATYGISDINKYHMWQTCFVTPRSS